MTATAPKPMPRGRSRKRIGGDEAREWARKLPLRNPYAKAIMVALCNYMNEDGSAFPGLDTLHDDTDIAEDTVMIRLRWLEQIGVIALFKNWMNNTGVRNRDGDGRLTSYEIRFIMDCNLEAVAVAARSSTKPRELRGAARGAHEARGYEPPSDQAVENQLSDSEDSTFSPRHGRTLSDDALLPSSPLVAPELPPPAAVRTLNSELRDSPLPPLSGGVGPSDIEVSNEQSDQENYPHAESWDRFAAAWIAPITRFGLCRQIWAAFTDDERDRFVRVVRGYGAWLAGQRRPPNRINPQALMRDREGWEQFEKLCPPDPKPPAPPAPELWVPVDGAEYAALSLAAAIARISLPASQLSPDNQACIVWRRALPTGIEPFAQLVRRDDETGEIDRSDWRIAEQGSIDFRAWCSRVAEYLGAWPEAQRFWLDEHGNVNFNSRTEDRDRYFRATGHVTASKQGVLVPKTENGFPPNKGSSTDDAKTNSAKGDQ